MKITSKIWAEIGYLFTKQVFAGINYIAFPAQNWQNIQNVMSTTDYSQAIFKNYESLHI
ncbi:hypothetical protein FDUTEX481_00685 [Tolypothrix sp. PCC 7601]|nr:hypothetical protein FDUTEX481_00685 [Tolypothrix sp. PCC 7601]